MKIDLEKYIRNHRDDLDFIEELDVDQMWNDFNAKNKPSTKKRFKVYLIAAVSLVLVGVVSILYQTGQLHNDDVIYNKLSQTNPSLAKEQEDLVKLISNQGEIINQKGIDEAQFPELFRELHILDSLQLEAMRDIDNYQDRKNLWKTLLRNYKGKARVLELMIYEFDKQENENNYENSIQI